MKKIAKYPQNKSLIEGVLIGVTKHQNLFDKINKLSISVVTDKV